MINLGLLSFSDGRKRVHDGLAADILAHQNKIKTVLENTGEIAVYTGQDIISSSELARKEAMRLDSLHLDAVIFNLPVFSFPNFCAIASQMMRGPFLLLGPQDSRYPGLGGLLGAGGALSQIGIPHERMWVDLDDSKVPERVLVFARAAAAVSRLRGQVFGLIGGRSIGMYTGAAPAEVWARQFGVDIEHVDQSEIVRRSQLIPKDTVTAARNWIEKNVSEVRYDGRQLTPEKFEMQIRSWIAVQEIVDQFSFDFAGIKCHFDMSEFYCTQCLAAAFINDPYDWRGAKQPVPLACEADSDGAMTMQIMRLITGKPSCLLDLRFYDAEQDVLVMSNCGATATWYTARSNDPVENLSRVKIVPSITKYAGGGAHLEFVFGPGPLTLARLTRSKQGYRLLVARGKTVDCSGLKIKGAAANWPHAYVRSKTTIQDFVEKMEANHLHCVAGDCVAELVLFSKMLNIECVVTS